MPTPKNSPNQKVVAEPAKAAAARRRKPAPKLPTAAPAVTNELIEEITVTETVPAETVRKTRQADPLLAAKKALVDARKKEAKAQARVDAHGDIIKALEEAKRNTAAAEEAFATAVENV